jgi:hypothetical protein
MFNGWRKALAGIGACAAMAAGPAQSATGADPGLHARPDGTGTTTFWGDGANYEIKGPGVTVFFLKRDDGGLAPPLVRVVYVGDAWINVRGVTFTVGERTYGPYVDGFNKPARIDAGNGLFVEALIFNVDSGEKWQMLDGIAEAADLGRPVVAVFDADVPYGIELDRAAKRATKALVRGFRDRSQASY